MSDKTPRTDAAKHASFESVWSSWVEAWFAEKLERENNELREENRKLKEKH